MSDDDRQTALARLAQGWVYGGVFAAAIPLALLPFLTLNDPAKWVVVALIAYMVHQYEEHDGDRFRRFVNALFQPARRGLTPLDVFVINVPGVWGVLIVTLYLAQLVASGWALIAAYLLAINGLAHGVQGLALRRYNPGLITGVILFLPVSLSLFLAANGLATPTQHVLSALLGLAIHAAILVRAGRRSDAESVSP